MKTIYTIRCGTIRCYEIVEERNQCYIVADQHGRRDLLVYQRKWVDNMLTPTGAELYATEYTTTDKELAVRISEKQLRAHSTVERIKLMTALGRPVIDTMDITHRLETAGADVVQTYIRTGIFIKEVQHIEPSEVVVKCSVRKSDAQLGFSALYRGDAFQFESAMEWAIQRMIQELERHV